MAQILIMKAPGYLMNILYLNPQKQLVIVETMQKSQYLSSLTQTNFKTYD